MKEYKFEVETVVRRTFTLPEYEDVLGIPHQDVAAAFVACLGSLPGGIFDELRKDDKFMAWLTRGY